MRPSLHRFAAITLIASACLSSHLFAAASTSAAYKTSADVGNSYGLLGWLDHRSAYGQGAFPEPFLVDDVDLETNEARLDWLHTNAKNQRSDQVKAEVEKGFGLLTVELEVPYERTTDTSVGDTTEGMSNIDVGARYPVYQFVSQNGLIDGTTGIALEIGIPTNSAVSKNAELVPKVFNALKLGDHFTLQSIFGYSILYGSRATDGGLHVFEYGFVAGYTIQHAQLPLPYVLQLIPVFELSGETELNKADPGHTGLIGDLAFRLNLKAIGRVQPRLGLGYVFPINGGGRDDVSHGIITSLIFEY